MSAVLFFHPEGNIKNNPNIYYFVKYLVSNNFKVVIVSKLRPEIYQGDLFEGAELKYYERDFVKNLQFKSQLLHSAFNYIIGIDDGIIEAKRFSNILRIPYAFLSYEIFFDHEIKKLKNNYYKKIKKKSKKACQDIDFAIAQDEIRRKFLSYEYKISVEKILLMPVAGSGKKEIKKTKYFHECFNLPLEKKILLYMGWIDELQLIRLSSYAEFIPDNWVFVIHSRYKYKGKIPKNLHNGKIFYSMNKPIENIEDIGILLSACDAGFCSYQTNYNSLFTGDNIKYIGLSSGKTTTFLQYGIPIVVENMNIWDEIIKEFKLGIVINNLEDLFNINIILDREYSERCYKYFDDYLDIKNFVPTISEIISKSISDSNIRWINYYRYFLNDLSVHVGNKMKLFKKPWKLLPWRSE